MGILPAAMNPQSNMPWQLPFMGLVPGAFWLCYLVCSIFLGNKVDTLWVCGRVQWLEFCIFSAMGSICLLDGVVAAHVIAGTSVFIHFQKDLIVPFGLVTFAAPMFFMIAFREFGSEVVKPPATPAKE